MGTLTVLGVVKWYIRFGEQFVFPPTGPCGVTSVTKAFDLGAVDVWDRVILWESSCGVVRSVLGLCPLETRGITHRSLCQLSLVEIHWPLLSCFRKGN